MTPTFALLHIFHSSAVDSVARIVAGLLLAGVWEGIVLAAAVGLILHLVPGTTARLRFAIWTIAFVVLAVLPLASASRGGYAVDAAGASTASHLQLDIRWSYLFTALWFAAVMVRVAHLCLQAIELHSLSGSAVLIARERLPKLALKGVKLCTSDKIDRPSVIGFLSPRILIPAWLFDQLTEGELEQIVLHELEHLRRRDDWVNLLQKIGLVLFPLNPALFWIDRRLGTERELACDDGVLSRTHSPRVYATCLTTLAERRIEHCGHSRLTVLALGAVGAIRQSEFSRRIEKILGFNRRSTLAPVYTRALAAVLVAGVLGAAAIFAHAPQLVSFADDVQSPAAQPVTKAALVEREATHSAASFQNVVLHQPSMEVAAKQMPRPLKRKISRPASIASEQNIRQTTSVQSPYRQLVVLTGWHPSAPQPLLVRLPDGRTFLATYAAELNQPGWLLIQL